MPSKTVNAYGAITIDTEAISMIAGLAATDCYGIVGMAAKGMRDGIVSLLKPESITKGVNVSVTDDGLVIDLHIIVEYGTNIPAIADSTINTIKYAVENGTGLIVSKLSIYVEGIRVGRD